MADESEEPAWLEWAKRLRTMAQTGLAYARDPYDIDRYHEITDIADGMMAVGTGMSLARVRDIYGQEAGHATPKLSVRCAVFRPAARGTEILMVREMADGLWTLPGGWADVGESPSEAAAREVLEESGYRVHITRLLAVFDKRKHRHPPQAFHIYTLAFAAEIIGTDGTMGDGHETDGVAFFPRDALPPLSLRRASPSQIERLFQVHEEGAATWFD
jgi:ADP-ribose pyrophosphatase YjhB (NUDIX family)